ncbi:MAG TPA: cytochrome c oxidase assembly protein [Baekduia sp.]|nr:cytochrome c oxidase assembly protein [Baekduia sp.]
MSFVTVEPLQLAPILITGVLYNRRVATLSGTPRAVPALRQWSFYGGIAVFLAAVTLLGKISDELFAAHMAEHLLLADVGSLLIVLGLTGPVLAPVLRLGLAAPLRVLAHPVVALVIWTANLYFWHLTPVHEAAVEHSWVHALQHMGFVVAGANVWMALFGPLPSPAWFGTAAKAGYILGVRLISSVLANVFLFGGGAFYSVYAAGERSHGVSAVADQNTAGAVMMVEESILTICLFAWLFLRAARESEERQELLDDAARMGVELDPARAARAAAAGKAEQLRERLGERPDKPEE